MNGLFWILIALGANMLSGMCIRKGHDKIIDMGHFHFFQDAPMMY